VNWRLLVGIFGIMVAAACDESFSPIQPSELQLSVFGYLDASADTQWIRVMPVRPVLVTSPGRLAATVTLEHLGTGRIIELRDSVFRFAVNPDVGSEGVFLHNFWTTEKIDPGAAYLFSARPDGEEPSEAVVEIPGEYDVEVWLGQSQSGGDRLRLVGLKHMAFVRITHFYDTCGSAVESSILNTASTDSDTLMIPISKRLLSRPACGPPQLEKQALLVIGSATKWPSGLEYSAQGLGVSDAPSNISNSVGFLGGVLTKLTPFENCHFEGLSPPPYCRLRYDAAAASLRGTLTDPVCGRPVARATVRLREVNPDTPTSRKVRSTTSKRSGEYEIGALEEGRRYAFSVQRLGPDLLDDFQEHNDTLEFATGEQVVYDVGLRPLRPCAELQ
jgi:hypothetical protein